MALSTKTAKRGLPLAALGRLSVRDALNRGFELLDNIDASNVKLSADVTGGSAAGTTLQAAVVALTARVTAIEAG